MKKQKTIGIIGASRKLGVTHISIALANFIHSVLKQKVLYIELSEVSQLLTVVGDNQYDLHGHTAFKYKGVDYILACNTDDAIDLMKSYSGHIIIDINEYSEETNNILTHCDNRIVIGSMKPWCKKDMQVVVMSILEGGRDLKKFKFYNLSKQKIEITDFKSMFHCNITPLPFIENPYLLKENDFDSLFKMLE